MAPKTKYSCPESLSQEEFTAVLHDRIRQAVRFVMIMVLQEEVEAFVGAEPYERASQRRDQRNGYYYRDLATSVGVLKALPVPRTRRGFRTQMFSRYQRRRSEVDALIGQMFVRGVSTRGVGEVLEDLMGSKPSASTVSRVFHTLNENSCLLMFYAVVRSLKFRKIAMPTKHAA